eukprot:scaffold6544_cov112-Cylindrotheca_fusiformis.AAC.2
MFLKVNTVVDALLAGQEEQPSPLLLPIAIVLEMSSDTWHRKRRKVVYHLYCCHLPLTRWLPDFEVNDKMGWFLGRGLFGTSPMLLVGSLVNG